MEDAQGRNVGQDQVTAKKQGGWGRGEEGKQKRRWHGHMDAQLLSQLKRSAFHFNPGSAVMVS